VAEITNACSECILQLQTLIEQIWENIASFLNLTCLHREVCRVSSNTQKGTLYKKYLKWGAMQINFPGMLPQTMLM
jgi:hypothetical protein